MLSSPVIDLAVGLTFVFGVTAALASLITELIARLTGLRGAYLLSGLRELVDGGGSAMSLSDATADYGAMRDLMQGSPAAAAGAAPSSVAGALLGGPILGRQGVPGQLSARTLTLGPATGTVRLPKMTAGPSAWRVWSQRRSLPSYISGASFAAAVIDLVVPDPAGPAAMTDIEQYVQRLPAEMPFRQSLEALAKAAGGDAARFRASVERWYDDHMDRVSGWYKRHVAMITLAAGAVLIVLLNLNAVTIGRTLYTENAVSSAVSSVAAKATSCSGPGQQACLEDLDAQLSAAAAAGLPAGWGTVRDCRVPGTGCNWLDQRGIFSRHGGSAGQLVMVLIGFLVMIFAIVPGAQFWFGLLSKLGTLRSTGPKPATSA